MNFERRKNVLEYDDVMNYQRDLIYKERLSVLNGEDLSKEVKRMVYGYIEDTVAQFTSAEVADEWDFDGLRTTLSILCNEDDFKNIGDAVTYTVRHGEFIIRNS